MATLTSNVNPVTVAPARWLVDRNYDLGWFVAPAFLAFLLFLPPYAVWGSPVVVPLNLLAVAFFGLPHNYMTWAVTLGPGRPFYQRGALAIPLSVTAALTALLPLSRVVPGTFAGYSAFDAIMSVYTYIALWHLYRQHVGILKLYDAKLAKAEADPRVFATHGPLYHALAGAVALPLVWTMQQPALPVTMGPTVFQLVHPVVPAWAVWLLGAAVAGAILQTGLRVAARVKGSAGWPVPQLVLATVVALAYAGAFALVPARDMLLTVTLITVFHNIQYIGFVWHYHRSRAAVVFPDTPPADALHRWAAEGRFGRYMAMAAAYALVLMVIFACLGQTAALLLAFFHNTAHHLTDGYIWKRKYNPLVSTHLGL